MFENGKIQNHTSNVERSYLRQPETHVPHFLWKYIIYMLYI